MESHRPPPKHFEQFLNNLPTPEMCQEVPIAKDTTCVSHRMRKHQAGTHLETSSLLASMYGACWEKKKGRDSLTELWTLQATTTGMIR